MIWTHYTTADLETVISQLQVSSWRWECQRSYATDAALVQRWREGKPRDPDADRPWVQFIGSLRARGVQIERARMLPEPLTEYWQCMLDYSHMHVDAGEDIRWVAESTARTIGEAPHYDFYLLDDTRLAILDFDGDGRLADIRVTDEPDTLAEHRHWRELIWPHAIPHQHYRSETRRD